jgi:hypothetical protein
MCAAHIRQAQQQATLPEQNLFAAHAAGDRRRSMGRPPALLSGRAAERLARVQQQAGAPERGGPVRLELAAEVLRRPAPLAAPAPGACDGAGAAPQPRDAGRDADSELVVAAATLLRLRVFHGSLVKVRRGAGCAHRAAASSPVRRPELAGPGR